MTNNLHVSKQEELNYQYDWFCKTFLESVQNASDGFFSNIFDYKLISVSKNINVLLQGDEYFVTKVRIDKQHDIFIRCSSNAVKIILDGALGVAKEYSISSITDLEAKIISSFNSFLFDHMKQFLPEKIDKTVKRKNFDATNLTLFIRGKLDDSCGKVVISLPQVLVFPEEVPQDAPYDISNFTKTEIFAKIKVGSTRFHLKDVQQLEKDDIVVFEESNINTMTIEYKDYISDFNITPNPAIVTSIGDDDGGETMSENSSSQNLWDTIQVDMGAEFDAVKITLGDLKNIQAGMVVDLMSIYDNKVSLKVENNIIARGDLVIINDRFGVKISDVYATKPDTPPVSPAAQIPQEEAFAQEQQFDENLQQQPVNEGQVQQASEEEEFDYGDFDLDDQDL